MSTATGQFLFRASGKGVRLSPRSGERGDKRTPARGQNTQHSLLALLRQSIYSRLAGYEAVNDAERLCLDPAMRIVVGGRGLR